MPGHTPTSASASSSSPRAQRHRGSDRSTRRLVPENSTETDYSPTLSYSQFNGAGSHLPDLQMEDLELLHHFTTQTCFTLSDRPASHEIWRVDAPQVAFQHDFFMRGILAISALHLALLRPKQHDHFTQVAVKQQDAALSSFRPLMSSISETNCDAFFGLSSLIVVYGFESPKASDSLGMFSYTGQDSDEWLPLIRGVNSIIQTVWPWIKRGRLSGLLHDHQQESPQADLPPVLKDQLSHLETMVENASEGQEAINAYKAAVGLLRMFFIRINNRPDYECEVSIAFLWPVMVPQEYISLVNLRKPQALVILAHYCIILHHLNDYWWMRGWAMHIIKTIQHELDDEWRPWTSWVNQVITVDTKVLTNGTLQNPIAGNRVSNDFDTAIDRSLQIPHDEININ